jgi:hypothetical protein
MIPYRRLESAGGGAFPFLPILPIWDPRANGVPIESLFF